MTSANVMILLGKLLVNLTIKFWHVENIFPHGEMKVYISLKV